MPHIPRTASQALAAERPGDHPVAVDRGSKRREGWTEEEAEVEVEVEVEVWIPIRV